ncbi:MAG: TonB-dependent receptor [Acidobacteriota bacterium]|nr:TonB-dependent receptor [Acidobacteriota bacterium]
MLTISRKLFDVIVPGGAAGKALAGRQARRLRRAGLFAAIFALLLGGGAAVAQTSRGDVTGRISDPSGAAASGVKVTATNANTGFTRLTVSSGTGDFSLPNLPLGPYTVEASLPGFATQKVSVEVNLGRVVALNLRLGLEQVTDVVTVEAAAEAELLDLQSTAIVNLVPTQQVQELPMNGRQWTRLLSLSPGVSGTYGNNPSVNGLRGTGAVNYQLDGADNNEAWNNMAAVNQGGGAAGIGGTQLPVEAIDQFSTESFGSAEVGRNAGATLNVALKSGTNQLHGSVFYFNRHEALSAQLPTVKPGSKKRETRNNQFGFSVGGPIVKDKTFFFGTFEGQKISSESASPLTTIPTDAWVAEAKQVLALAGVAVNPVTEGLLNLWIDRKGNVSNAAVSNNYRITAPSTYDTYGYVAKVDHDFDSNNRLSLRYFAGKGDHFTTSGIYTDYFDTVPTRTNNGTAILTSVLSPRLVNSVQFAWNYYFQNYNTSSFPDVKGLYGLDTGSGVLGTPTISITGFGSIGGRNANSGRDSNTWHITDTLSWAAGAHQWKFGGEIRRTTVDVKYENNKRGSLSFDGNIGGWSAYTSSSTVRALADFLAGYVSRGSLTLGPTNHDYHQNSFDLFFHDTWTATDNLTLNFGVRYTYQGVLGASDQKLTTFFDGQGLVSVDQLYPKDWNNFAPRVGFAYTLGKDRKTVVRGGYGLYYSVIAINAMAGAGGVGHNPGGENPVYNVEPAWNDPGNTAPGGGYLIRANVPVFELPTALNPAPKSSAFSVSQDLTLPYVHQYSLNVERQLGPATGISVGYVGTRGRNLTLRRNLNKAPAGTGTGTGNVRTTAEVNAARPYAGTAYAGNLLAINQVETVGRSTYNSLQVTLTQKPWRGLSGRVNYTLGHAQDNGSGDSTVITKNDYLDYDWGDSAHDVRHVFSAGLTYEIPAFTQSRLGRGWQVNAIVTVEGGTPITVTAGRNYSGTGDSSDDRAVLVGNPYGARNEITADGVLQRHFLNATAFTAPAAGQYSVTARNSLRGPAFNTIDFSLFKNTQLSEGTTLQLRFEAFNVFNNINWSNPGSSITSSTFGIATGIRDNANGIGVGGARNAQLAVKFLF